MLTNLIRCLYMQICCLRKTTYSLLKIAKLGQLKLIYVLLRKIVKIYAMPRQLTCRKA